MDDNTTHYHYSFRRVAFSNADTDITFETSTNDLVDTKFHLVKGIGKIILQDSKTGATEELTFPYEPIELYDIKSNAYVYEARSKLLNL
jgi:hypothetical protein